VLVGLLKLNGSMDAGLRGTEKEVVEGGGDIATIPTLHVKCHLQHCQ
jgi:hypothetical protein